MPSPSPPPVRAHVVVLALSLILGGCITNNWLLELIVSKNRNPHADASAGPLLTFLQYAGVSMLGVFGVLSWKRPAASSSSSKDDDAAAKPAQESTTTTTTTSFFPRLPAPHIPLRFYALLVLVQGVMSVLNNLAFAYNISQPVHMVFRSSTLVVSFLMGSFFFGKQYTAHQFVAVVLVSIGAFLATAAEALVGDTAQAAAAAAAECCSTTGVPDNAETLAAQASAQSDGEAAYMLTWYIGIGILATVLALSALLSQYQDGLKTRFGRYPQEMLFWSHFLCLPLFMTAAGDLVTHAKLWSASPPASQALGELFAIAPATIEGIAGAAAAMPIMWLYVAGNVLSQFVCVRGVFMLGNEAGALTLVLTLTVRKFVSLFVSIWFFGNTFTSFHWAGAVLVLVGVTAYNLAGKGKGKGNGKPKGEGEEEGPSSDDDDDAKKKDKKE